MSLQGVSDIITHASRYEYYSAMLACITVGARCLGLLVKFALFVFRRQSLNSMLNVDILL